MLKKIHSGFTLIEILVVTIIIGILSSAGVVAYKEVTSTAKEKTAYSNYKQVVKSMESEFTKCKLDKSSKIFNSHSCNSSNNPSANTINNYIDHLFKNPTLKDRTQLILIAGIVLNNVELIKYAADIDPNVVKAPIPNHILTLTDAIMSQETGITLSKN